MQALGLNIAAASRLVCDSNTLNIMLMNQQISCFTNTLNTTMRLCVPWQQHEPDGRRPGRVSQSCRLCWGRAGNGVETRLRHSPQIVNYPLSHHPHANHAIIPHPLHRYGPITHSNDTHLNIHMLFI